jgi:16S rRNA (cytidine1402-2'-O)-methyltransferase
VDPNPSPFPESGTAITDEEAGGQPSEAPEAAAVPTPAGGRVVLAATPIGNTGDASAR